LVLAFACSIWFLGLNAIEQRVFKHVLRPPATLDHENSLSMYLCTVTPLIVAATMSRWPWWFRIFCGATCLLAMVGEVLTVSRTGMPVLAFGVLGTAIFCTSWRFTRRKALTVLGCAAAAGLLLVVSWDRITVRYKNNASMEELMGEGGFESRSQFWTIAKLIAEDRPYGVGLNNWSYEVSKTYASQLGVRYNDYDELKAPLDRDVDPELQPIYAPPAHSIMALTWGELGTIGLVLLMLVWLRWFQMGVSFLRGRLNPDPMHRLGIGLLFCVAGMFLHSVTEWTYRQTQLMFTFHVLMGALASLYYVKKQRKRAEKEARKAGAIEERVADEDVPLPVATYRRGA
jgi:O-antigen ligase